MGNFVHLHVHTEYSLLDGISKIKKLVKRAKELGMESLAITDHGVMYGAIEFYKACTEAGIKPIIGVEMYVAPRLHNQKEGKIDADPFHLTVLAKNETGYKNLMKLVSISWLDGYYYRPRVDRELLRKYSEGLIVLSGCPGGEFIRTLDREGLEKAEKVVKDYIEIFGADNYYFEVQNHHYFDYVKQAKDPRIVADLQKMGELQEKTWAAVKELSKKLGVGAVATKDLHYIEKADAEAHDAVLCVQTGKLISDIDRLRLIDAPELYLKSPEEMVEDFKDWPEVLDESVKIAEKCDLKIDLVKAFFPVFPTPEGKTAMEHLREMTYKLGAEKLALNQEERDRLEYELDIIDFKNYGDYFLVVADFMNWARDNNIVTNTRGSAAGSLVLYCLGITNLNPLEYMLPFERFLTKTRPSMPDIDADLADDRREDVIKYVTEKYGEEKVAQIVTFGTMQGRAAIRDIGRVLDIPLGEVDKIAKLVPPPKQGFHTSLEDHLEQVPELKEMYNAGPQYKKLLDLAMKIEGTVRHASVHAAGVLITPEDITNFTPVQREAKGEKKVSQFDMFSVVDEYGGIGLVKMDFLGLRNLSILGRAVEFAKENRGVTVDLTKLPLDDKNSYDLLARGETMGLFQLGGDGMTKYLMELRPTNVFDIMAMVALYRPGPLAIIPEYIARKRDPSKVTFIDERMRAYMEMSLGLLVYQEDVILTAINIAGYTWEEADKFRKAMGKKKPEEMAKQRGHFVEGCVENGMEKQKAEELFDQIEAFAAYGFNKSHASSYGLLAYQTAYMKANFPVEYMAALMTAEYGDTDKIARAIEECKRMGIVVLPPDVNYSKVGFTIELLKGLPQEQLDRQITDGIHGKGALQGIRFGLSAIKNVGIGAIESIIKARESGGKFKSLADLCNRIDTRLANRKTLESLIKAGALDSFGVRAPQLTVLEKCLEDSHKLQKIAGSGQGSLFDGFADDEEVVGPEFVLPNIPEMPFDTMLGFEKDLLGFYLHEPTFMKKVKMLKDFVSLRIGALREDEVFEADKRYIIGGVIQSVRKIFTKKNNSEMAFLRVFDGTGEIDVVVFPKLFADVKHMIREEEVLLLKGKVDTRNDDFSFLVDEMEIFDEMTAQVQSLTAVEIEIPKNADGSLLKQVNQTLRQYPGVAPISILIPAGEKFKRMSLAFTVEPNGQFVQNVESILGPGTVKLI